MKILLSTEEFNGKVSQVESQIGYKRPLAFGICVVESSFLDESKILQATFPVVNFNENFGSAAIFIACMQEIGIAIDFSADELILPVTIEFIERVLDGFYPYINEAVGDVHKNVQLIMTLKTILIRKDIIEEDFRLVMIFNDVPCTSVEGTYLKLYALSTGKAPLRSLNLNGAFGALHNIAWSDGLPYDLEWLRINEIELRLNHNYPKIDYVDKFPRFLQHIIPVDNVRVLDDSKVRLGAYLAPGTTVMPGASYINFNSGTTGKSMVEGRISSSAIVGDGTDIGGGASILGVLSGTDGIPVTIGKNCLLGANSVTGISLGDGCIVDAGIAVLAGTKFKVIKAEWDKICLANPYINNNKDYKKFQIEKDYLINIKGSELSGLNGIHFRQDNQSGAMIIKRSTREVKLNDELH